MREDEGLEGGNKWLPYGLLTGFTLTLMIHHFASTPGTPGEDHRKEIVKDQGKEPRQSK